MTQDLGRVGGSQAGRQAGCWTGGSLRWLRDARLWVACLFLAVATPAAAVDEFAVVVNSYAQCVTAYKARGMTDYATYCRKRFPLTVQEAAARSASRSSLLTSSAAASPAVRSPAATTPAAPPPATTTPPPAATAPPPAYTPTTPPAASTQTPAATPPATRKPRESVDITPAVNRLIESWANRPRTPKPPPGRPADPLSVIPDIQAACATYAGDAARWRRCTSDAWKTAGLRGQPPVVLQVPPAPPPPAYKPPVYEPPPPPARREPPVQSRPPPPPPPAEPPPVVQPEPPVATVTPPPVIAAPPTPRPEPPPAPAPPSIPSWAWWLAALVALVVAGAGGFGLAKLLNRARPKPSRAPRPEVAACEPAEVVLVVDPGVVALIPDGSPRAGMAVSMRFALDVSTDEVRLDYPSLETAP
ncbi:hypothetical protein [Caulobacter soli]|uniref:hypothetical protein n=1 Tax=Caulobacter soli TaxID=2708539 RepID=UPI0013ED57F8|nr:hypothetical protein [Caulobacter soli]